MTDMTYYAMFLSPATSDACEYVGPFTTEEDAEYFVDEKNSGLADRGLPALWSVV